MNIKNIKQFDENSGYYAGIVHRIDKRTAEYEAAVNKLKTDFVASQKQDVLDKKKLEKALLEYAEKNQSEFISEDNKTYTNAFVELTIKMSKPSIKFIGKLKEADVIANLKAILKKKASLYINVKETLAKTAIATAINSKTIKADQLEEIGIKQEQLATITLKPL